MVQRCLPPPSVPAPTADPYTDTDVVDARAPRFLQATVGAGAVLALLTGWWWLYGLLALQLVAGLVLGRRWCLPCVAYFALVQPRVGEGRVEDARPPRFANKIGATVLGLAFAAHLAGLDAAGTVLGPWSRSWPCWPPPPACASAASCTSWRRGCGGSAPHGRRPRPGRRRRRPRRAAVVQFTHPLCSDCHELEERLAGGSQPLHTVDVSRRPDLARRYHVAVVPAAFRVAGDGTVLERLA